MTTPTCHCRVKRDGYKDKCPHAGGKCENCGLSGRVLPKKEVRRGKQGTIQQRQRRVVNA